MSMMWLDRTGTMLGRVLCVTGVPVAPNRSVTRALLGVHDAIVLDQPETVEHLACALSRPGAPKIAESDDEWAEALHDDLDGRFDGTWSLHLVAGGSLMPLTQLPSWTLGRQGLRLDLFDAAVDLQRPR